MRNGRVGPKEITVELLKNAMSRHLANSSLSIGFLIDGTLKTIPSCEQSALLNETGFPRKLDQAMHFERSIGEPLAVLVLDCPENVARARLYERAMTAGRFDDNNATTIAKRFETFKTTTQPVLDHYEQQQKVYRINGVGTRDEVHTCMLAVVDEIFGGGFNRIT